MNPLNQWTCTVGWLSVPLCRRIVRQVLFDMCNVWFMMAFLLFYGGKGNAFFLSHKIFGIFFSKKLS